MTYKATYWKGNMILETEDIRVFGEGDEGRKRAVLISRERADELQATEVWVAPALD